MNTLKNKTVVVAGGTGNVGSFIVKDLLQRGATVGVPSRSTEKIKDFRKHLAQELNDQQRENLHTFVGDIGDEKESKNLLQKIPNSLGTPNAAIASLGYFVPAPSLLEATVADLQKVIDGYLISHFIAARTFLKKFKESGGGTYVFVNGPLAMEPWEGSGAGLVSTVTAGQQMLFRTLAQELKESQVTVTELMNYAYIRNRTTQPGSDIPGEATGAYASYLVSGEAKEIHGKTHHLKNVSQIEEVGISY